MSETCENWLSLVDNYIYSAHQISEIHQELPYSVDSKTTLGDLKSIEQEST